MQPRSAGILLHRGSAAQLEVLLVHPGGPFWRNRWSGAWQIPKGQVAASENPLQAALREFEEELGTPPPGTPVPLGSIRQSGGKIVEAYAMQGDLNVDAISSNSFTIEWPPRSGQQRDFPEVDAARWFTLQDARANILASQSPLLDRLESLLAQPGS